MFKIFEHKMHIKFWVIDSSLVVSLSTKTCSLHFQLHVSAINPWPKAHNRTLVVVCRWPPWRTFPDESGAHHDWEPEPDGVVWDVNGQV